MFEFFFTLTVAFLAYVANDALTAVKRAARGEPIHKPRPVVSAKPVAAAVAVPSAPAPKPAEKPGAAAPAKAARSKPAAKPDDAPAVAAITLADQLRNPATGEVTAAPANYRFAKKWIKDALVSEKLLDRVYKPSELDAATAEKVRQAIDTLRGMPKYHG